MNYKYFYLTILKYVVLEYCLEYLVTYWTSNNINNIINMFNYCSYSFSK